VTDSPELKKIGTAAAAMLRPLASASIVQMVGMLKPYDEDYERVFVGRAAGDARVGYEQLWMNPPRGFGKPGQSEVHTFAVQAKMLATENEFSMEFPGGYRKIAELLVPDRIWLRFKFVEPGKSTGMAYDGLVWLDGRWAWFPKPWHVISAPPSN
jgi:hypothetical protein